MEEMFQGRKMAEGKDCGYVYNFVLARALQGSDFSVQAQRLQKLLIARYTCIPFFLVCRERCVHHFFWKKKASVRVRSIVWDEWMKMRDEEGMRFGKKMSR